MVSANDAVRAVLALFASNPDARFVLEGTDALVKCMQARANEMGVTLETLVRLGGDEWESVRVRLEKAGRDIPEVLVLRGMRDQITVKLTEWLGSGRLPEDEFKEWHAILWGTPRVSDS